MIRRKIKSKLAVSLSRPAGKPLVLRGARQVGKTVVVRRLAETTGCELCELNLEQQRELERTFLTLDAERILEEAELLLGHRITPGKSLLFLDEIQATPSALPALRYLHEAFPDLCIIAAGSLLEMVLHEHRFSMPVGRIQYAFMGPVTFEEFLEAREEELLLEAIQSWIPGKDFSPVAHDRLLRQLRTFLLVGGMPEATDVLANGGRLVDVRAVHASIAETFRDDFSKYATGAAVMRLRTVFDHVPVHIGRKLIYAAIDPESRSTEVKRAVDLLCLARVVFPAIHSAATGLPLGASSRQRIRKLYFLDVGLMNHVCGVSALTPESLVTSRFVNEGPMAEQFVAQHLLFDGPVYQRPELHYWLREGKTKNAEVDFLRQVDQTVVPIEVKAGASGSLKSLLQFIALRESPIAVRFNTCPPAWLRTTHSLGAGPGRSQRVQLNLLSLPLYMVGQIDRLVRAAREASTEME